MLDTDQKFDHSFNSASFSDVVMHQPIPLSPATAGYLPALSVPGLGH